MAKKKSDTDLGGWLQEEGQYEEATASAIKLALAHQLEKALAEEGLSKSELARRMQTSRPALDRLLDPENESLTLATLEKAARAVGRTLRLELLSKWLRDRPLDSTDHAIPLVLVDDRRLSRREKRTRNQQLAGSSLFEVTAEQISDLDKYQIVELLRRLIAAELFNAGIPLRTASVPLEINIPDGGVDGRANWYGAPNETDYLPSRFCIFQCKVKDTGAAKLKREVWKKSTGKAERPPELTGAMSDLLDRGGSYILVVGSRLSDSMVQARIDAIRQSIRDAGGQPDRLTAIEIYHADVLADWANSHPSIALWVNGILRTTSLSGFQTYDQWAASEAIANTSFIEDDEPRFSLSGGADTREAMSVGSYPTRLAFGEMAQRVANFLSESQRAVHIVGPSGYGKTRAAFQLFSPDRTRADRLESTAIVYANYEDVKNRLGAIALDLAENGAATILVVDDCPYPVHQDLLNKARRDGSRLRIVTTDVEVRPQPSRHNLVVELGPASNQLIERIVGTRNSSLATTTVQFIRELSQGVPRMAILAVEALDDGLDVITTIDDLIDRIVWGRNIPDKHALRALELASLFSFVGIERDVASELSVLAEAAELSPQQMRDILLSFRERGIVVPHGDYLEIQPLPLAARLGAKCLERMPDNWLSKLFANIHSDMQMRLLRRLRWLDKSKKAVEFADRVLTSELNSFEALNTDDGAKRLDRLVHVDPNRAMATLTRLIGSAPKCKLRMLVEGRRYVVWALEKLAFRRETFVAAATLLRRLGAAETEDWGNNAAGIFVAFYQLYLGGTEADPAMRLEVLKEGLASNDQDERKLCVDALGKMLRRSNFVRSGGNEQIGSGPPLIDWRPKTWGDVFSYHSEALERLRAIACTDDPLAEVARNYIGSNIRGLLSLPALFDDVRRTILDITAKNKFWVRGIEGVYKWLYFEQKNAPKEYGDKVRKLYDELVPNDPVKLAVLYCSGWRSDLHDPDRSYKEKDHDFDYTERQALGLADVIASDNHLLTAALANLTRGPLNGVFPFARRLAERSLDPVKVIKEALLAAENVSKQNIEFRFFAGFLSGVDNVSHEAALQCFALLRTRPGFEDRIAHFLGALRIDTKVLSIVVESIKASVIQPESAAQLSFGRRLDHLEPAEVRPFFEALIATGTDGLWAALEALYMYQHWREHIAPDIVALFKGTLLDPRLFEKRVSGMNSHHFEETIALLHRQGCVSAIDAELVTKQILRLGTDADFDVQLALEDSAQKILKVLISQYPNEVWNQVSKCLDFKDPSTSYRMAHLLQTQENAINEAGLLNELPQDIYLTWLNEAPGARLRHVLGWVPLTEFSGNSSEKWHPDFERLVDKFLMKKDELAIIERRLFPTSWSGSLADQLEPHLSLLQDWWCHPKTIVHDWAMNAHSLLSTIISEERRGDANREISYRS